MAGSVRDRVLEVVSDPGAEARVARYFDSAAQPEVRFTGRLFEQFGLGGDHPATANFFTADDLLAVESLSVSVPPEAAYEILYGSSARKLADLLADIPTGIDLGTAEAAPLLAVGTPARRAWDLLDGQVGIGWVTAGKLLARKRPQLLPVYDRVVRCVLGRPAAVWLDLHEALTAAEVRDAIDGLRPSSAEKVSTLRLLDVAIWTHHRGDHVDPRCPYFISTKRE